MTEYKHISNFLGGSKTIKYKLNNRFDLIQLSKKGIPKKSLVHFASKISGFSIREFITFLPLSLRTLQRYKPEQKLDKATSEYLLEIAYLYARGINVFGSLDKFKSWINTPLASLGGKEPAHYLDTSIGINYLKDLLGRIEHGIF